LEDEKPIEDVNELFGPIAKIYNIGYAKRMEEEEKLNLELRRQAEEEGEEE